jgi:hypothetical protein
MEAYTVGNGAVLESCKIRPIKLGQALYTEDARTATGQLLNSPAGVGGFWSGRNPSNPHQIQPVSTKLPRTPGFLNRIICLYITEV